MFKTFYLVNFVLFHWICFIYGAVRHTAKSNLLNEIEIERYSLHSLWEILIKVQLLLISWQYYNILITTSSKDFSNIADDISAKLLSSFLECEMLVVISDWYGFEFSIKEGERKQRTEDSTHIQEIKITDNRKVPKSFQSCLGNSNNKNNFVNRCSKNGDRHCNTF